MNQDDAGRWFGSFLYNERPKKTLAALLDGGRFPHALILQGPPGSGRRTLAALVAAVLFEKANEPDGGQANHKKKVLAGIHPDFTVLSGEGGARSFHAETVRRLRMDAHIRPNEAGCRVFVLTDADFMTIQAQNALLKLMEEPPDHVFLILTCADVQALLPTVRSRATVIPMEVLPPDRCAEGAARLLALRASGGNAAEVSPEERKKIAAAASFSGGSIGGTLAALEDQRLVRDGALLGAFFAAAAAGREYEMLRQLVPLEKDRERFIRLMGALKTRAVSTLSQSGAELSPEAAVRLARLADEAARTAAQNVTLAPLCAWLCRRAAG